MNPVVTVQPETNLVTYELTEEDLKKLDDITLIEGAGGDDKVAINRMCIMQAVVVLTGAPSDDGGSEEENDSVGYMPVCASKAVCSFMVAWNDEIETNKERGKLKDLIREGVLLNTRPVIRKTYEKDGMVYTEDRPTTNKEYRNAEKRRETILRKLSFRYDTFEHIMESVRIACDQYRVLPGGIVSVCGAKLSPNKVSDG